MISNGRGSEMIVSEMTLDSPILVIRCGNGLEISLIIERRDPDSLGDKGKGKWRRLN